MKSNNKRIMTTYIYVFDCALYEYHNIKTVHVDATDSPMNIHMDLQKSVPVKLDIIKIYEIINYSAYDVSGFLKRINDYQKYLGDINIKNHHYEMGGTGHYILPNLRDLERLFDKIGVIYKCITDYSVFDKNQSYITRKGDDKIIEELGNKLMNHSKC